MRHLAQVGNHRLAGNVLAHRNGQWRIHFGIDLRTQYLGQMHDLPFRVGQLQCHIALAGYGLNHADAHHRQGTRQIAHQIHDLAALHTDGGIDLVAGNDRAGISADHFDFHAEILELALDQTRGEFQRLGSNHRDLLLCFIQ